VAKESKDREKKEREGGKQENDTSMARRRLLSGPVRPCAAGPAREGEAASSESQQIARPGPHALRRSPHLGRRVDVGPAVEQQPRHLHVPVLG
jgi:hypothetical protein